MARAATSDEVKVLRKEARDLKEVVAEQALELRLHMARPVCKRILRHSEQSASTYTVS
jgi:hypothetical protein